jgi:acyl dehydratase
MNGGQVAEFFAPMRPGDVITSTSALVEFSERQTRLGLTLFSITENRWTNQRGELVKTTRSTLIQY